MRVKQVEMWVTTEDGKEHRSLESAEDWDKRILLAEKATKLLREGATLETIAGVIGVQCPDNLKDVTQDFQFMISHWQCKDTPGYKVIQVNPEGTLWVYGDAGSWTGPYGDEHVKWKDLSYYKDRTDRRAKITK